MVESIGWFMVHKTQFGTSSKYHSLEMYASQFGVRVKGIFWCKGVEGIDW